MHCSSEKKNTVNEWHGMYPPHQREDVICWYDGHMIRDTAGEFLEQLGLRH